MHNLKVKTEFTKSHISQSVQLIDYEAEMFRNISQQLIPLQDEGIRQALIELGWTPPEGEEK